MFKPILAVSLLKPEDKHDDDTIYKSMQQLKYPVIATPKYDGIRALKMPDSLRSRTLKLIPNDSIRMRAREECEVGYDMELYNSSLRYDEIESIVMSDEHPFSYKIQLYLLDSFSLKHPYEERIKIINDNLRQVSSDIHFIDYTHIENTAALFQYFLLEEKNGEGICFRTPNSPYKEGRSTLKEQYLVKLSRYIRSEYVIVGFEEQMFNGNKEKRNTVGKMDRSSFGSGLIGKDTLGAFWVHRLNKDSCPICDGFIYREQMIQNGKRFYFDCCFKVGTGIGLTDKMRKDIWLHKEDWIGKTIVIKSKPFGEKNNPRSPIFIGLRNEIDL